MYFCLVSLHDWLELVFLVPSSDSGWDVESMASSFFSGLSSAYSDVPYSVADFLP